jgi:hypothetical protein
MVNVNRKGRDGENRLQTFLTMSGYEVELLRLQGINDPGDLWVPEVDTRIQMKNHANIQSALNEAIKNVTQLDERFPLSKNYAVAARVGKGVQDWYAVRRVGAVWPPKPDSEIFRYGATIDAARTS